MASDNPTMTIQERAAEPGLPEDGSAELHAKRRSNRTIDARLARSLTAIDNAATVPELRTALEPFSYGAERLAEGRALHKVAREAQETQKREYGEQYGATDALHQAWYEADRAYIPHLKIARIALGEDRAASQALTLVGERAPIFNAWLSQAKQFYTNLLGNPAYIEAMARFGQDRAKIESGLALVLKAEEAAISREKEKGEAQRATDRRDVAMAQLDQWMSAFISTARIALVDDRQRLEQLGILARN